MNRIGIIDIGTNSVLLLICQYNKGKIEIVSDISGISRLGEGIQKSGVLSDVAMKRTEELIASYLEICKGKELSEIVAVGTSALRDAANSGDFVRSVKEQFGIDLEIISGKKEAELSYVAVSQDPELKLNLDAPLLVVDVGGGSTEVVIGDESVKHLYSLSIGAVKATDLFLKNEPPLRSEIDALTKYVEAKVLELKGIPQAAQAKACYSSIVSIIGIGGTITNLAAVKLGGEEYDREKIHGLILTAQEIEQQIELYCSMPLERRCEISGLEPKRADVIIGGAAIFKAILKALNSFQVMVSDRGLRYGIAYMMARGQCRNIVA